MPSPKMHALRISCLIAIALMLGGFNVMLDSGGLRIGDLAVVVAALVLAIPVWIFIASFHAK